MNLLIVRTIRFLLGLFRIFPVKKNKLVFISFNGKSYACSPKAITEELFKDYNNILKIVWVLNDPVKYFFLEQKGVTIVKKNSIKYIYHILTAKIIISNTNIASIFPRLRKHQFFINTWHGGGAYKRVSDDVDRDRVSMTKTKMIADQTSLFISSNRRFSEVMSNATKVPIEKMWEIGLPRNDILFHDQPDIITKIKNYYDLDEKFKIVLYAPTYRGSLSSTVNHNDIDVHSCLDALKQKFGGEWCFFYRAHYFFESTVNQQNVLDPVRNVSDYDDMQELLCASDILITDYSSSMWDFSFTGKPCFIYATDISSYQQERDFYTPMSKWPFAIASDNNELSQRIRDFEENSYIKKIEKHHEDLGSFETGSATRKVLEFIIEVCAVSN